MEYLLSIPGVGLLTAATIVAETNGFAAFENIKQLTSYVVAERSRSMERKKQNKQTGKQLYSQSAFYALSFKNQS
jgi:transposase